MHDFPIFIFAALLIFAFGFFSRVSERSFAPCIAYSIPGRIVGRLLPQVVDPED